MDRRAGEVGGADGHFEAALARSSAVTGQVEIEGKLCQTGIRKSGQLGDDTGSANGNLASRPEIYRLPDPHVAIAYLGNPVPANGAEHGHILADVAGWSAIVVKIFHRL